MSERGIKTRVLGSTTLMWMANKAGWRSSHLGERCHALSAALLDVIEGVRANWPRDWLKIPAKRTSEARYRRLALRRYRAIRCSSDKRAFEHSPDYIPRLDGRLATTRST